MRKHIKAAEAFWTDRKPEVPSAVKGNQYDAEGADELEEIKWIKMRSGEARTLWEILGQDNRETPG